MKFLTLARDLRRRKARERQGLFVAEGVRSVEELLRSPLTLKGALAGPGIEETARGAALLEALKAREVPVETVSEKEFASAAETDSPQGILAVAEAPAQRLAELPSPDPFRMLVLDAVQDPGNVGTIIRTAAALGAAATLALPGTVDLWNAKVVRSGMGAHFHHPCLSGSWDELSAFRQSRGVEIWAADAAGSPLEVGRMDVPARLALIVGNEGAGLSPESRAGADRLVALPIASAVESLNVAVAAGILLYELRR